uniref:Uncharacterized protein n=1 Tax=Cacopsylla melanoneura TaxID=428564 RepID=A0A8D8ZGL1_9HEMI
MLGVLWYTQVGNHWFNSTYSRLPPVYTPKRLKIGTLLAAPGGGSQYQKDTSFQAKSPQTTVKALNTRATMSRKKFPENPLAYKSKANKMYSCIRIFINYYNSYFVSPEVMAFPIKRV